jgi:hypothetical protein
VLERVAEKTLVLAMLAGMAACTAAPLVPLTESSAPLVLLPVGQRPVMDQRGRFREIACAVLNKSDPGSPDYRPCDSTLVRVGVEPEGASEPVSLDRSDTRLEAAFVPGVAWECFGNGLDEDNRFASQVAAAGYRTSVFRVDGLSGSENNARQIRDSLMARAEQIEPSSIVLIGYSKGVPDVLTALVNYPEIHPFIAAVVSLAGAVGGSPLAYDVSDKQAGTLGGMLNRDCSKGDGRAVESLRPSFRQSWLRDHRLPNDFPYYSLVTYPLPDQVSRAFHSDYEKLSQIDPRNDSKLLFYDQIIPGSSLLAYLNADHLAVAAPVSDKHPWVGRTVINRNHFPREAIAEALMRFIEEDLARNRR